MQCWQCWPCWRPVLARWPALVLPPRLIILIAFRAGVLAFRATARTGPMPNAWRPRPGVTSIATSIPASRLGEHRAAGLIRIIIITEAPRERLDSGSAAPILNHMVKHSHHALDRTFAALADPTR